MRVLYIHMTGAFAGGSRSLFEAVRALPKGEVQPLFVAPKGSVHDFFAGIGEVVDAWGLSQFDNTRYSHYRGLRWLVLLRELAFLPSTFLALRRAHRRWKKVDLIHVNPDKPTCLADPVAVQFAIANQPTNRMRTDLQIFCSLCDGDVAPCHEGSHLLHFPKSSSESRSTRRVLESPIRRASNCSCAIRVLTRCALIW